MTFPLELGIDWRAHMPGGHAVESILEFGLAKAILVSRENVHMRPRYTLTFQCLKGANLPLFGATVGVKDIIHTKGTSAFFATCYASVDICAEHPDMPTRFGSKRYEDYAVAFDASVVQILRRAGCVGEHMHHISICKLTLTNVSK